MCVTVFDMKATTVCLSNFRHKIPVSMNYSCLVCVCMCVVIFLGDFYPKLEFLCVQRLIFLVLLYA